MKLFERYAKPGKGVTKEQAADRFGFRHFFVLLRDKFWNLVLLNFLFFVVNLPVLGLLAYLANVGGNAFQAPVNPLFGPMQGVLRHGVTPFTGTLYGVLGTQVEGYYPSTLTYVFLGVGTLTVITFGLGYAAMTYVQRNFVKGEPTTPLEDFFSAIRRNWKQGILLGILDLVMIFVILFDLTSYYYSNNSFGFLILFYLTVFLSILYFFMRPYLYLQIVTFNVRIPKAIKNSYIMALAGVKRNLLCTVLSALLMVLNYVVFVFLPSIGVFMVFLLTVSLAWFLQIFAAWPVVKKYMIDPYYKEEKPDDSREEAVFTDRG